MGVIIIYEGRATRFWGRAMFLSINIWRGPNFYKMLIGKGPLFYKTNVACTVCSFLTDAGHLQGL